MVNLNGRVIRDEDCHISLNNRAFKYGDGIFDTLKFEAGTLWFLEDHYFRLMSSMRMLRMKIPMDFTLSYYEEQLISTLEANGLHDRGRVRISIYRNEGGLYTPERHDIGFVIEAVPLNLAASASIEIELYKDFPVLSGLLSTIKTNNRLVNVLGSIFKKENDYDNCILINEKKEVVEALNANVFIIKDKEIVTPVLDSGCINGIIRKKLLEDLPKHSDFQIKEVRLSPFELLKADEIFLTNSIVEIQSVDKYRKKTYASVVTDEIREVFRKLKKG